MNKNVVEVFASRFWPDAYTNLLQRSPSQYTKSGLKEIVRCRHTMRRDCENAATVTREKPNHSDMNERRRPNEFRWSLKVKRLSQIDPPSHRLALSLSLPHVCGAKSIIVCTRVHQTDYRQRCVYKAHESMHTI